MIPNTHFFYTDIANWIAEKPELNKHSLNYFAFEFKKLIK